MQQRTSPRILATGRQAFGDRLKSQSLRTVRVITDTAEYSLAYLLRDDEKDQIRIGTCVGEVRDEFEISRRLEWQVLAIPRASITSIVTLS